MKMENLIPEIFKGSTVTIKDYTNLRVQTFGEWLETCLPGDEWVMTKDQIPKADAVKIIADTEIRKRNPQFRIWRQEGDLLVCKLWLYETEKVLPFRKGKKKVQPRNSNEPMRKRWK